MSEDRGVELFSELPKQAAPLRPDAAAPRLRTAERRQVELRAVCLDELVASDHRVRLVWRFVEGLDLGDLYGVIKAVEGKPGHPPADPRILMALWLYATTEGVASAREVARLCEAHIAYQWLCGGVGMNAKTLADFRVQQGAVLERLLIDSFAALLRVGVASLERVAQDGVRVRASAGAASFRRHSTLEECRAQAEAAVRRLGAEAERDPGAASRRQAAARLRAAEDRERRVEAALAATGRLRAQQQDLAQRRAERAFREKAKRARDDAARDDAVKDDAVKDDAVKDDARDDAVAQAAAGEVPQPASQTPKQREPRQEKEPRASTTDAEARVMKMPDGGFRPAYNVQFVSDTKSGAVAGVSADASGSDMGKMAPMNAALERDYGRRAAQHLADGGYAKLDDVEALAQAGVEVYAPVPAPRDKSRDRHAILPGDTPHIAAWRKRMGGVAAKEIYKERAATAECVHAQARNRGLTQFLVRGLGKIKSVALWHGLTHNMMCSFRLVPT